MKLAPFVLALGIAAAAPLPAPAVAIILSPGAGEVLFPAGGSTLGFDFTMGATSMFVDALGIWDADSDGFVDSHQVGLWTSSGTLLASATVPAGAGALLDDGFRYIALASPLELLSGQTYVLGATYPNSDALVVNVSPTQATFATTITGGNRRFTGPGFEFPADLGGGSFVGPNARIAVPEPTTALLIAAGALPYLARRRRKQAKNARR
jgi:Domain of unknown function (DUF4082)